MCISLFTFIFGLKASSADNPNPNDLNNQDENGARVEWAEEDIPMPEFQQVDPVEFDDEYIEERNEVPGEPRDADDSDF
jgi:hypothetical protein